MSDHDPARTLFAEHALLPGGWARDVLLQWDATGVLSRVQHDASTPPGTPRAAGPLLPGMPNLHSHAFQRVFAGLSECRAETAGDDSFWSWRERMYRVANAVSPEQLETIATQLYIEMLQAGYTSVCEFHYLHRDAHGRAYAEPAEMALRLVAAARRAGIRLILLPVLYQQSGFGGRPARSEQRRFVVPYVDELLEIVQRVRAHGVKAGAAPHSLRAVVPAALRALLEGLHAIDAAAPLHLHIAEQPQEVADCIAWSGQRPVAWLFANAPVDARWCLVHATHLDPAERAALAASGAVAGLCPSTEANLGDGVFDAATHLAAGGAWGIGSDSHVGLDAAEELRLLEYTQRLALGRRNVLADGVNGDVAEHLWLGAVAGGARASGGPADRPAGLAAGSPADAVVLETRGALAGLTPPQALASHVFASHRRRALRDVWVGGVAYVRDGVHAHAAEACTRFITARHELLAAI